MKRASSFFFIGVLPALVFQLIGASIYFYTLSESALIQIAYTITKILVVVWPLAWYVLHVRKMDRDPAERDVKLSVRLGLLFGLGVSLLIFGIYLFFQDYFLLFSGPIGEKVTAFGIAQYYIPFALFLSIAHSGIEEYYWRWFIFRGLKTKLKPLTAAIVGSLAFTSHHVIILLQFFPIGITIIFSLGILIGGLTWCGIYYKTRSLAGAWLSHFLIDAAIMTVGHMIVF